MPRLTLEMHFGCKDVASLRKGKGQNILVKCFESNSSTLDRTSVATI